MFHNSARNKKSKKKKKKNTLTVASEQRQLLRSAWFGVLIAQEEPDFARFVDRKKIVT